MSININDGLCKAIIEIIKDENGRPLPIGILLRKISQVGPYKNTQRSQIFDSIALLTKAGKLKQLNKSGSLVMGHIDMPLDMQNKQIGIIAINATGNGFITLENEKETKYFVHRSNTANALNGDKVEFAPMLKEKNGNLIDASVLSIIEHAKDYYVCTYVEDEKGFHIVPDDERNHLIIKLDSNEGLYNGDKILIKIYKFNSATAFAKLVRVVGHKNDVGTDILSIVLDEGIEPDFSDEVIKYATSKKEKLEKNDSKIRKDITNLNIVTIDPTESKDFDDAFFLEKKNDEFYLNVSIADVSHYVDFNSILDDEAAKRTSSLYLVDRVIPMLPNVLSNDICSLNPNVKRFALTCEMIIDKNGNFKKIDVYPSTIMSHRRFTYDEVNNFFDGSDKLTNDTIEIKNMLNLSKELHNILRHKKQKEGYVNLHTSEPYIVLDKNNIPIEIKKKTHGEAQEMIEDFMVCANEAVTLFAHQNKLPFIYRIHEPPTVEKINQFLLEVKPLDFKITGNTNEIKPIDISNWLEINKQSPNIEIVSMMLLRCMAKAKYSTDNKGHFGLALKNYTHFTSPIRRYIDLIIHRIYWMYVFDRDSYSDEQRSLLGKRFEDICKHCNEEEIHIQKIERDVNNMKFAEYMENKIGEEYDAKVVAVAMFGVFVQLDNLVEGLVSVKNMGNDYFIYNNNLNELVGEKTRIKYTLGKKIRVKLLLADKNKRHIEFGLIK